jgi:hypothetical protein
MTRRWQRMILRRQRMIRCPPGTVCGRQGRLRRCQWMIRRRQRMVGGHRRIIRRPQGKRRRLRGTDRCPQARIRWGFANGSQQMSKRDRMAGPHDSKTRHQCQIRVIFDVLPDEEF